MQLPTSMHLHMLSCLPDTPTLALHLECAYSPFGLELTSAPHGTPSPTPESAAPSVSLLLCEHPLLPAVSFSLS